MENETSTVGLQVDDELRFAIMSHLSEELRNDILEFCHTGALECEKEQSSSICVLIAI